MALRDDLLSGIANRQTKITFPNNEYSPITSGILSGSLELDEMLCTQNVIDFSEINASRFQCVYADNIDFTGKKITVTQTVGANTMTLFTGYVESCNVNTNDTTRTLIAYDPFYKYRNKDISEWYNGLTFPITIANFRNGLFQYLGLSQVTTSLPNDSITINKEITPTTLLFSDVISDICEFNGVIGHFNRAGYFKYIDLTNVTTQPISDNYSSLTTFENYNTDVVTGVALSTSDDSVSEFVGANTNNVYSIVGNMFTFGFDSTKLITTATNIYNKIKNITFRPCNIIPKYSEPNLELGTKLTLTTYTSQSISTFMLQNTLRGAQFFDQTITAISDKTRVGFTQSDSSKIDILNNKSHVFRNNIDELYSRVEDAEGYYSVINQTADQISWIVGSGESESDFTLTDRTAELVAQYINLNGLVTFNGIDSDTLYQLNSFVRNSDFRIWEETSNLPFGISGNSPDTDYFIKYVENGANCLRNKTTSPNQNIKQQAYLGASNISNGFFQYNADLKGKEYIAYDIRTKLLSGNFNGSGITFRFGYYNTDNVLTTYNYKIDFSDKVPSPTLNEWVTINDCFKIPDEVLSGMLSYVSAFYRPNHEDFGTLTAKDIIVSSINFRPSSYGEFLATAIGVDGQTIINGGLILTNSIYGDSIKVNDLFSKNITYTGKITGGNVSGGGLIQSYNYSVDDDGNCTNGMSIDLRNGSLVNKSVILNNGGFVLDGYASIRMQGSSGESTMSPGWIKVSNQDNTYHVTISNDGTIRANGEVMDFGKTSTIIMGTGGLFSVNNNDGLTDIARVTAGNNLRFGDWSNNGMNVDIHSAEKINFFAGGYPTQYVSVEVVDGTARLRYNGSVVTGSGTTAQITSGGYIVKSGSSRKYKENFDYNIEDCEEIIKQLRPCRFNFKGYDFTNIGLIAEDVQEVCDSLVIRDSDGNIDAVHYQDVTVMLLQVVQKLLNERDSLQ